MLIGGHVRLRVDLRLVIFPCSLMNNYFYSAYLMINCLCEDKAIVIVQFHPGLKGKFSSNTWPYSISSASNQELSKTIGASQ